MLLPLMILLSYQVQIKLGHPIFFKQLRAGKNGKPFEIIKFRTMRDVSDENGKLLSDIDRVVPFGNFLRNSSLDELPSLWNVLRGDMSLVGPRPLLIEYLPLYSEEQSSRHDVCPGITGWAQVNGRNAIAWEDKFRYDIWYVKNQTLWLDLKIIYMTINKVIAREGISADGEATMPKFTGSKPKKVK